MFFVITFVSFAGFINLSENSRFSITFFLYLIVFFAHFSAFDWKNNAVVDLF